MKDTLSQPVLVLNKGWTAIGTTTVKDAIVLMSRDSARALCTASFCLYDWETWVSDDVNLPEVPFYIPTPNLNVPAPQVIILTHYNALAKKTIKFSNKAVYRRDNFTCQYCKKKFRVDDLSIDHIVPRAKNGKTTWENCVTACFKCNNKKSDRTLKEAGLDLPKVPKRPPWNPVVHIRKEARPESWKPLLKDSW